MDCDEECIGVSARTLGQRFKEHFKASSPIYDYFNTTGLCPNVDNISVFEREVQSPIRTIKEAIFKG